MQKWMTVAGVGVSLLVVGAAAQAQRKNMKGAALTPSDYMQIQELYGRYDRGCDEGNNAMIASAWTSDGELVTSRGTDKGSAQLGAHAGCHGAAAGPLHVGHLTTTVMLTPTPEGANGFAHVLLVGIGGDPTKPATVNGGIYEDVFVRTPEGWRIKRRTFTSAKQGPNPTQSADAR